MEKIQRGTENWTNPLNANTDIARDLFNRIYEGRNLAEVHFAEIQGAPHNGSAWAWIRSRIRAGNFDNIVVGDFIPFTTISGGILFEMEVAGINAYKGYGDQGDGVGNHIDFISRDCHPNPFVFNRANYNNGTTVSPSPYLASSIYARLNALSMSTPSAAAAGGTPTNENFTTTGLLTLLPAELRSVIVQKRLILPSRFTAGALLTDDNSWAWADAGLLWLPSEMEVYGTTHWGSGQSPNHGFEGGFVQYPLFTENMKRIKHAGKGGARTHWWLLSARGGDSTTFARVGSQGYATGHTASTPAIRVPLCFRIA